MAEKHLLKTVLTFKVEDMPEQVPQVITDYFETLNHIHDVVMMHIMIGASYFKRNIIQTHLKYDPIDQQGNMLFSFEDNSPYMHVDIARVPFDASIVTMEMKADRILRIMDEQQENDPPPTEHSNQVYEDLMAKMKKTLH